MCRTVVLIVACFLSQASRTSGAHLFRGPDTRLALSQALPEAGDPAAGPTPEPLKISRTRERVGVDVNESYPHDWNEAPTAEPQLEINTPPPQVEGFPAEVEGFAAGRARVGVDKSYPHDSPPMELHGQLATRQAPPPAGAPAAGATKEPLKISRSRERVGIDVSKTAGGSRGPGSGGGYSDEWVESFTPPPKQTTAAPAFAPAAPGAAPPAGEWSLVSFTLMSLVLAVCCLCCCPLVFLAGKDSNEGGAAT